MAADTTTREPDNVIEVDFAEHALETMPLEELVEKVTESFESIEQRSARVARGVAEVREDFDRLETRLALARRRNHRLERELAESRRRECTFTDAEVIAALTAAAARRPAMAGEVASLLLRAPIEHYHRVRVGKALGKLADRGLARRTFAVSHGEPRLRWLPSLLEVSDAS